MLSWEVRARCDGACRCSRPLPDVTGHTLGVNSRVSCWLRQGRTHTWGVSPQGVRKGPSQDSGCVRYWEDLKKWGSLWIVLPGSRRGGFGHKADSGRKARRVCGVTGSLGCPAKEPVGGGSPRGPPDRQLSVGRGHQKPSLAGAEPQVCGSWGLGARALRACVQTAAWGPALLDPVAPGACVSQALETQWGAGWGPGPPEPWAEALCGSFRL